MGLSLEVFMHQKLLMQLQYFFIVYFILLYPLVGPSILTLNIKVVKNL